MPAAVGDYFFFFTSWPMTPPKTAPPTVPAVLPPLKMEPPTAPTPAPMAVPLSCSDMPAQAHNAKLSKTPDVTRYIAKRYCMVCSIQKREVKNSPIQHPYACVFIFSQSPYWLCQHRCLWLHRPRSRIFLWPVSIGPHACFHQRHVWHRQL